MPITKLETQVFNTRSPLPPSVIIFHPYDQHIAVAAKESFGCVLKLIFSFVFE